MAEGKDLAKKTFLFAALAAIAGIAAGTWLVAPAINKSKDKTAANKKDDKKSAASPTKTA